MRVLICGGREFADYDMFFRTMTAFCRHFDITHVIHGGARGADEMARQWAMNNEVPHTCYPAKWTQLRNAAGPARNAQMLLEGNVEYCIAFPGNAGTADMRRKCVEAGVAVWQPGLSL